MILAAFAIGFLAPASWYFAALAVAKFVSGEHA